ncbi:CDP-glycerol--glycerophosphate glycerophosphotransferase [Pediococcus parvulus]|uniref:CDP-glycerol--glycerophosphate glycerophosphotransferase n=1 Tax=Pediococcus parvulus TaxID=54062 RepID=A0AAP5TC06_9LACO|nr:CDP-glycerol glycerophosphotransferase family protein [Pediococcus parvulus]MDV7693808.1 CDP-glycerol--glycerophosphate glycerophosphotransferase [Pediococcus parvulus]
MIISNFAISLVQTDDQLKISVANEETKLTKLFISPVYSEKKLQTLDPVHENEFCIDLKKLIKDLNQQQINSNKLDIQVLNDYVSASVLDDEKNLEIQPVRLNLKKADLRVENLHAYSYGTDFITPYITRNGFLAFSFNAAVPDSTYVRQETISSFSIDNESINISGNVTTNFLKVKKISIDFYLRSIDNTRQLPGKLEFLSTNKNLTRNRYNFSFHISKAELADTVENIDYIRDVLDFDISVEVEGYNEILEHRLGRPRAAVKQSLRGNMILKTADFNVELTPYFTLKGNNLAMYCNVFNDEAIATYKKVLEKKLSKEDNVWLIGEKSNKAQDNGYFFFKYLRKNHPEINAYYVIDEISLDRRNFETMDHVVAFNSAEHFRVAYSAKVICGTHDYKILLPTINRDFLKLIKAKIVFLQHGVLGTKNLVDINGRMFDTFYADVFVTSSTREKNIVVNDLKYPADSVLVSGLPRFDRLFLKGTKVKKQILIIPTWRDWLRDDETFKKSNYLSIYNSLINHSYFHELANEGYKILFCLHPNAQQFLHYFDIPDYVIPISQGEAMVQDLIKESCLMLTDYSSVGIDFSFLDKPVIYYEFDQVRFLGKKGSHLNLEHDLPGDVVYSEDQVIESLRRAHQRDFKISEINKEKSGKFLLKKDLNNSERVFEGIQSIGKETTFERLRYGFVFNKAFNRFRKSRHYFKIMQFVYSFMKVFCRIKPKQVIFESGIGKQYSDSPKQIYQKMLTDPFFEGYKFIWIYNGYDIEKDDRLKIIKRFSWEYFYYLATSEYWVNNQNFPYYIHKPKHTTFLQTWHGTPLKKMMNDVDSFSDKDAGYVPRMNKVNAQWDYLVSPSHYATERFESAFLPKAKILEVGYPRNDVFFLSDNEKGEILRQLRNMWGINNKKVILYAPTFRDDDKTSAGKQDFKLNLNIEAMYKALHEDYVVLFRQHAIVKTKLYIPDYFKDFFIDVSKFSDVQQLYLLADMCVTDYSSVMFDYAITKKPLLFYTYDYEDYKENLRGFYIDFEAEAPGPLLYDTDQLIDAVQHIDQVEKNYESKYQQFYNKYGYIENGTSTKKVIDAVWKNAE